MIGFYETGHGVIDPWLRQGLRVRLGIEFGFGL